MAERSRSDFKSFGDRDSGRIPVQLLRPGDERFGSPELWSQMKCETETVEDNAAGFLGTMFKPYGAVWVLPTERESQIGVNKFGDFNIRMLEPEPERAHLFKRASKVGVAVDRPCKRLRAKQLVVDLAELCGQQQEGRLEWYIPGPLGVSNHGMTFKKAFIHALNTSRAVSDTPPPIEDTLFSTEWVFLHASSRTPYQALEHYMIVSQCNRSDQT